MTHHDLDTAVRSLDPATSDPGALAPETVRRILASPAPRRRAARPARRRRILLVSAATCAGLVVAAVAAVGLLRPLPASATWTPTGTEVALDAPGVRQCEQWWTVESTALEPVFAEVRGDVTLVLGTDDQGRELLCTAHLPSTAWSEGDPAYAEPTGGMTSLVTVPPAGPAADGALVVFVDMTYEEALPQNGWQSEGSVAVAGHVGDDVVSVVLETEAGTVEATVQEGRFIAWWPLDGEPTESSTDAVVTIERADGSARTATLEELGGP